MAENCEPGRHSFSLSKIYDLYSCAPRTLTLSRVDEKRFQLRRRVPIREQDIAPLEDSRAE